MTRLKRVTEEVARWVFEVKLLQQQDWFLAFTNPTAGPWKRVMMPDTTGSLGEVHRFERDATRPDLILVSDKLQLVVIVEAKTSIDDLRRPGQVAKTVTVVEEMGALLRGLSANRWWAARANYTVACGLLWGGEVSAGPDAIAELVGLHTARFSGQAWLDPAVLVIECLREKDQEHVSCSGAVVGASSTGHAGDAIRESLGLAAL
ncbi:MAG: hypothetical protein ACRDWY_08990 [Actinomycetes bacterium]